ncbi:hypothetical protein HYQ46_000349 [Verticillium longisporum]|nr:hypothetical protein HYQ44_010760 [Verticillium longisporum]KAG7150698.1 hypothetical protein HYQ46_000349 [Verticillium longisporum]
MPSSHHPSSETDSPLRAHLERSSHWSHPYLDVSDPGFENETKDQAEPASMHVLKVENQSRSTKPLLIMLHNPIASPLSP